MMNKRFLSKRNYCKISRSSEVHPDSIDMSYQVYKNRESQALPLIVLHGLLGSKLTWKSFCSQFHQKSQPARVTIAVDLRDHGQSPRTNLISYPLIAEDIKTFLIKNKINRSCFLGHCFGGRGLMCFALRYPDYIDKVIIADASSERATPFQNVVPELIKQLKIVKLPQGMNIIDARHEVKIQLEKHIYDTRLVNFLLTNLYIKSDGSIAWKTNFDSIASSFKKHLIYFPKEEGLNFQRPALFINGEKSNFLIKEDHRNIFHMFPKAQFYTVKDAGHWVHSEKPQEFLRICLGFLNQTDR